jgi:hypothetical protein
MEMWHFQVQNSFLFGCLVVMATSLKPNDSYIKAKESEHVKGVAAQIIHIQNTVCQTIVKEPQNEVWLVEC